MFNRPPKEKTELEKLIDETVSHLRSIEPDSDEFATINKQLSKLMKLKTINGRQRVSADTLAVVAGNVAVALVVVGYERMHVVGTKASNFLLKGTR